MRPFFERITLCSYTNIADGRQAIECHGSGSPMYLAPETILEKPVDSAVDIWACGVILYLLLVSKEIPGLVYWNFLESAGGCAAYVILSTNSL